MTLVLLLMALAFNMGAQFVLKRYAVTVVAGSFSLDWLGTVLTSPPVWLGAFLYGGSFLFYLAALTRGELGRIGMVSQALTVLGIALLSTLVFHEELTAGKVLGACLLVAGIVAIFQ